MRIPGFIKRNGRLESQSMSFESVCAPGHYIRQKNYEFVLGQKGEIKFGELIITSLQSLTCWFTCNWT